MPNTAPVNPLLNLLPLFFIFIVFYFLLIRPQKLKDKEHKEMLGKLTKNDEIITTGGIHGTVINVRDKTVTLRVDDNVKIEIEKNCIVAVAKKVA
jgi:preprotein translocase subunit YajC